MAPADGPNYPCRTRRDGGACRCRHPGGAATVVPCPRHGPGRKENVLSEPFIYIGSYRIKPDFLDVAPQRLRDVAALVEEKEPQLRSFHFYLDEDHGRAICVQVHPDGASMATHMAVIANHLATAWDWLELDGRAPSR